MPLSNTLGVSGLDDIIEIAKKLSLLGGIVAGLGLLMLYFFGIAIYSSFDSAFGVPPFDLNLQNCLEYGSIYFGEILAASPYLMLRGVANYFEDAATGMHIVFALPIVLLVCAHYLRHATAPIAIKTVRAITVFTLLYLALYMLIINIALLSALGTQNLMLDPAVNIALKHRAELLAGTAPVTFGIHHWDGWTLNTVLRDIDWKVAKVGAMFAVSFLSILIGFYALRVFSRTVAGAPESGITHWWLVFSQRAFFVTFILFIIGFLFVTPGRTYTLISSTSMPKVDVDVPSRTDLTAKYYFVQVAQYEHSYAFYVPNLQQVIVIPKDKVNSISYKGNVNIFSERHLFRKGVWLGAEGDWVAGSAAGGTRIPSAPGIVAKTVIAGSPAHKAGVMPDDLITGFNGVPLDTRERLYELIEQHGLNKPALLAIQRAGRAINVKLWLENQP